MSNHSVTGSLILACFLLLSSTVNSDDEVKKEFEMHKTMVLSATIKIQPFEMYLALQDMKRLKSRCRGDIGYLGVGLEEGLSSTNKI